MPTVIDHWVIVPTAESEKYRKQAERKRIERARYESKRNDRSHGKGKGTHHSDRRFVAWDGEGPRDAGYALFGNSDGAILKRRHLGTTECLDLILSAKQLDNFTIHIWFGGNYDVSMILKDLSWRHLSQLHHYNMTVWRDYEIEHIPHKWFKVKKGNVSCRIFDIRSFFAGDYVSCLTQFGIGTHDQRLRIEAGKRLRDRFTWEYIDEIEAYWRLELSLMPDLMEKLRDVFRDAGYVPASWHGPGALARMALSRHNVYDAMAECPSDVRIAAQYAFAGGRFEDVLAGHVDDTIYVADLHSAYPAFACDLPNLARGNWRHTTHFEPGKFAVYYIQYDAKPDSFGLFPLFRRMAGGQVAWPHRTEGWYWAPEAELVKDDPSAVIVSGHVFDETDPRDRPFAFLREYYAKRALLKRLGNPAEYTFKLIINAIYGQLAQRVGWDRKRRTPPKTHQLEWAGYITSACRASVYKVAKACGDKLVSIDTDGVTSLAPFDNIDIGEDLGQWEISEYTGGIFWQSGIYYLRTDEGWTKAKTRGIPKGKYTAEQLLECLYSDRPLSLTKRIFVGYGLADSGSRDKFNTWQDEPHEFEMGGSGKRAHFRYACKHTCSGNLHRLAIPTFNYGPTGDKKSVKHWLPWQDRTNDNLSRTKVLIDDLTCYDVNDLDPDDEWIWSLP